MTARHNTSHLKQRDPANAVLGQALWWLASGAATQRNRSGAAVLRPEQVATLDEVRDVVSGMRVLELPARCSDADRYRWLQSALERLAYRRLQRADRGAVLAYLQRLTGYSRAQVTRLVARWNEGGALTRHHHVPSHAFERRYTEQDLALLAEVDALMAATTGPLSGAAMVCLLRRQRDLYGDTRFQRLGSISVARLYQLRRRQGGAGAAPQRAATAGLPVGRRQPALPPGTGHIRVDRIAPLHLPGLAQEDGPLLQVRLIDTLSKWQLVLPAAGVSAADLRPLHAAAVAQFPFEVCNFLAAEGAGTGLLQVAETLNRIHQAASACRDEDSSPSTDVEPYFSELLNPFLNLHLPCQHCVEPDAAPVAMTPLDRLATLPPAAQRLKGDTTLAGLKEQAAGLSDLEAAEAVLQVRQRWQSHA